MPSSDRDVQPEEGQLREHLLDRMVTLVADQVMKFEDRVLAVDQAMGFQDEADLSVKNAAEATDGIKSTIILARVVERVHNQSRTG